MNVLSNIRFKFVKKTKGLLGFVSFSYKGELACNGVAIHQSLGGEYFLRYPAKVINDEFVYYFRPMDSEMEREIHEEVVSEFLKVQSRIVSKWHDKVSEEEEFSPNL